MDYETFVRGKLQYGSDSGFEPLWMPDFLFDFQEFLVGWAIHKGRGALFTDCGTGKSVMELVWAQNVLMKTNRPVLILTPLAVTGQFLEEAEKFGIEAYRAHPKKNPKAIQIINYEQIHKYDPRNYAGVVCDESSCLKNFKGKRKGQITEFMRTVLYRLLGTATAAPNDWEELGTSSEALGYFGYMDMLGEFFTNKQQSAALMRGRFGRDKWRLRGHAVHKFWRWVASWARAARKPSDLGFDDNGFILPELIERETIVKALQPAQGMLFDIPAVTFHEEREVTRRTIQERCEAAAEKIERNGDISIAWCNLNDEGNLLERLIPNARQIAGRQSDEEKEEVIRWFIHGTEEKRRVVGKASMIGFGLNLQHCAHMTYFPDHSWEKYYQASRRLWRFGQTKTVVVDWILTDGGKRMMKNLNRKAEQASEMFDQMIKYMGNELMIENVYEPKGVEVPAWIM